MKSDDGEDDVEQAEQALVEIILSVRPASRPYERRFMLLIVGCRAAMLRSA